MIARKYLIIKITLFLILSTNLFSQYSYMPDTDDVSALQKLYLESGFIFPLSAYPLSKRDLYHLADTLNKKVSGSGIRKKINRFILNLNYEPDKNLINGNFLINMDYYARSAEKWPDFTRLFLQMPDIFLMNLHAGNDEQGGFDISAGFKKEYKKPNFVSSNLFGSKPGDPIELENYFIRKGYFYYFNGPLSLTFGRNSVHYGSGNFSTLYPGKQIPFLDALTYQFHLGNLRMESYIATLENHQAAGDVDLSGSLFSFEQDTILATMHRFEYAWDRIRISIGAQSFITRSKNGFQLGDIFPVFSWHNTVVGEHNMSLLGDMSFIPLRGMEVYMMGGFDDINVSDLGITDSGIPTIPAWILGINYNTSINDFNLGSTVEVGRTHYLWGSFYDATADSERNPLERAIYRYKLDSGNQWIPMTSPYGPGAFWVKGNGGLVNYKGFSAKIELLYLEKLSGVDLASTKYERNDALKNNTKIMTWSIGLNSSFTYKNWGKITIKPVYFNREGTGWVECTFGFSLNKGFSGVINE